MSFFAKFWGVRGSIPSPISNAEIEKKIIHAVRRAKREPISINDNEESWRNWLHSSFSFAQRATFGGNTTCVEVRCGEKLFILDMGTGLRELGLSLLPETFANKGSQGVVLQSHVHWDHIQGYPFWPQLYMPRAVFQNKFDFWGGRDWSFDLEKVLQGQMDGPVFPVKHAELAATAMEMNFHSVWDGTHVIFGTEGPRVTARKLNHPQETYGYRIDYNGRSLAFTTDHEPYAGNVPPRGLVALVKDVDVWITDCQYTFHEYCGGKGVQKMGWGHSYPEYIAQVADVAKPKRIITTHHDPQANDDDIERIATSVGQLSSITTDPAYEGMQVNIGGAA